MKKKVLAALLAATVAATALVGCGGQDEKADTAETTTEAGDSEEKPAADAGKEKEDLVVYGIYKAGDQTWFIDEGEAAKAAVEAAGGTFVYES